MSSKSTRRRSRFLCLDCGHDTGKMKEFYFVQTEVWLAAVGSINGMLCVGCLEQRLGRHLTALDFTPASINNPYHGPGKSSRLMNRLQRVS